MCRFVSSLWEAVRFFCARTQRGDLDTLRNILDQVPDGPVREGDERLA